MQKDPAPTAEYRREMRRQLFGFLLMASLTALAFWAIRLDGITTSNLHWILVGAVLLQTALQLYTFMHLREKGSMFYNVFLYTALIIGLISAAGLYLM